MYIKAYYTRVYSNSKVFREMKVDVPIIYTKTVVKLLFFMDLSALREIDFISAQYCLVISVNF